MSDGVMVWGLKTQADSCRHDESRFHVTDDFCESTGAKHMRDPVYFTWDMLSHLGPGALDGLRTMPLREEWPPDYWYLQEIPPTAYSPPDFEPE